MTVWAWKNYKDWIESTIDDQKTYFYRGQRDPKWKLQTSFHRESPKFNYSLSDYLNYIVPEVHYYVCANRNEIIRQDDPIEFAGFLALLQHHGFPTPLLDWSLSPYIAAYFAFREIDVQKPGTDYVRIYIFDASEWVNTFEQIYDLRETTKPYVTVIRPVAKNNERLIVQRGAYTVTNVSDMQNHLTSLGEKMNKMFLYVVDIDVSEKPKVMKDLNLMGINEMTLFPGMDGICKALRNQYFSNDILDLFPKRLEEIKKTTSKNKTVTDAESPFSE